MFSGPSPVFENKTYNLQSKNFGKWDIFLKIVNVNCS